MQGEKKDSRKRSLRLENLTWLEAESALKEFKVVMIPLGARTKEHGPHLPLNNDWIMAEYLAERVAEEVPVMVMPSAVTEVPFAEISGSWRSPCGVVGSRKTEDVAIASASSL